MRRFPNVEEQVINLTEAVKATQEDKQSLPMNNVAEERAWLVANWGLTQKMGMILASNEEVIYCLFLEQGTTPDFPFEMPVIGPDEKARFLSEMRD